MFLSVKRTTLTGIIYDREMCLTLTTTTGGHELAMAEVQPTVDFKDGGLKLHPPLK